MLRNLIEYMGKSIYAVSKESGVPYTTLNELVNGKKNIDDCSIRTIAALANYFEMPLEAFYNYLTGEEIKVNQTWQEKRYKKFIFPLIQESDGYDARRIHPLKQRTIFDIYMALKNDKRVKRVILFGSSTTIRCTNKSDIDLAVELQDTSDENKNAISELIQKLVDWKADIIWMDRVEDGSKLSLNIMRGVEII